MKLYFIIYRKPLLSTNFLYQTYAFSKKDAKTIFYFENPKSIIIKTEISI